MAELGSPQDRSSKLGRGTRLPRRRHAGADQDCASERLFGSFDDVHDVVAGLAQRRLALMRDEVIVLDDQNAPSGPRISGGMLDTLRFSIPGHLDPQWLHAESPSNTRRAATQ